MSTLNFNEVVHLISTIGKDKTVLVSGEMGIGKSSIPAAICAQPEFADYNLVHFDCTTRSEGDLGLPWKSTINGHAVTQYAATEFLGLHLDKPTLLNFDELAKASRSVRNSVLPIILERRFGTQYLHPDSVVMATTNLASELLGDELQPQQRNRMTEVVLRKPKLASELGQPDEWLRDYAIPKGLDPVAVAFCLERPQIFADYSEGSQNPYIHRPGVVQGQFVTPRSFTDAMFKILPKRQALGDTLLYAALEGTIGTAATVDFVSFLRTDADLPRTADIVKKPAKAALPKSKVGELILVYRLAMQASKPTIDALAEYVHRMQAEKVALFTHIVASSRGTMALLPDLMRLGLIAEAQELRTA